MIKLLILDIDGVMTDGAKVYGLDGLTISKRYCDRDFTAIKQFKASGVQVCFLSGDDKVNKQMAKNRKTDFYYSREKEKTDFLPEFEKKYSCSTDEMAYVGDDIFDIPFIFSARTLSDNSASIIPRIPILMPFIFFIIYGLKL